MAPAQQLLIIVHVFAAMYWFGSTAGVPRRLREALDSDVQEARRRMAALGREGKLFVAAGAIVFLSGLAMALLRGFGLLPVRLHVGLGLTVLWFVVGAGVLRPTMQRIGVSLAGSEVVPDTAIALRKRVTMLVGVQHLLFTVITVLMLWRI